MFEYELKKLNLSEKREQQLKLPYIAKDVETIRIMTEIYCHAHHNTKEGLCPECEEFYLYSVKRLACCPFGEKKPVCSGTDWKEMYQVFNMGHRMEIYVRPEVAEKVIAISKSFNIDAQVVGHIEEGKRSLTIKSEFGTFEY